MTHTIYGRWDDDGRRCFGHYGTVVYQLPESFEARLRRLRPFPGSVQIDYGAVAFFKEARNSSIKA